MRRGWQQRVRSTILVSSWFHNISFYFQLTVREQHQYPNDQTSKCQTNTFLPTRFSSCRIYPKASPRINSQLYFLSCVSPPYLRHHLRLTFGFCDFESCRYPNLHEVRMIATKKDIAFVEFIDEGSATVAKDALHNYKLDGENKIKVNSPLPISASSYHTYIPPIDHFRKEVEYLYSVFPYHFSFGVSGLYRLKYMYYIHLVQGNALVNHVMSYV